MYWQVSGIGVLSAGNGRVSEDNFTSLGYPCYLESIKGICGALTIVWVKTGYS